MGNGRARKLCQGTRDSRQGLANHCRAVRSHADSDSDPNARAEVREEARAGHVFLPKGWIIDKGMVVYAILTKHLPYHIANLMGIGDANLTLCTFRAYRGWEVGYTAPLAEAFDMFC